MVRHVILLVALGWRGRGLSWWYVRVGSKVHSMIPFPSYLPCMMCLHLVPSTWVWSPSLSYREPHFTSSIFTNTVPRCFV